MAVRPELASRRPTVRSLIVALLLGALGCTGDEVDRPGRAPRDGGGDVLLVGVTQPCTPRQISVGRGHACAVLIDGRAYCWGSNASGELGLTDRDRSDDPVLVGDRAAEVTAGVDATCLRLVDGTARCWGAVVAGQPAVVPAPLEVGGNISQIVLGVGRGCVLRADGAVLCWGPAGTVGTNDNQAHVTPTQVPAFPGRVAALAGGEGATCAVQLDGRAFCWGTLPQPIGFLRTPTEVRQLGTAVVTVGVGRDQLCALSNDGVVRCVAPPSSANAQLEGRARLSVGARHACALSNEGKLACFGDDSEGQLDGISGPPATLAEPRLLANAGDLTWQTVSAGSYATCAIDSRFFVRCWGALGARGDGGVNAPAALGAESDGGVDAAAPDAAANPEVPLAGVREPALPRQCP